MSRARSVSQLVGANTALGNTTISGALATGNTVITGTANVSSTLAAGNTTIVGFANVSGYGSGTFAPYNDPLVVKGQDYTYLHLQGTNNQAAIIYNRNGTTGWFHGLDNSGNMTLTAMASMNGTGVTNAKDGTPALFVDTSGRIRMPSQPAFTAFKNTGSQYSSNNTVIPLGDARVNIGSNFNTSTSRFTAPIAGNYFISGGGYGLTNPSVFSIRKNGSRIAYLFLGISDGGTVWMTHTASFVVTLAVNDYIDLHLSQGSVGDANDSTYLSGYLIG